MQTHLPSCDVTGTCHQFLGAFSKCPLRAGPCRAPNAQPVGRGDPGGEATRDGPPAQPPPRAGIPVTENPHLLPRGRGEAGLTLGALAPTPSGWHLVSHFPKGTHLMRLLNEIGYLKAKKSFLKITRTPPHPLSEEPQPILQRMPLLIFPNDTSKKQSKTKEPSTQHLEQHILTAYF